ncbi:hypothetical protein [Mesoterricola sediminis]|uniref:DUF4154 domain-containing protein n=1 Tax=Mesoterricola sediminis TaxID=2927980 RepID=A0AA48GQI9_9BACT|nr:hypothetical protein [Mesoterricola sediminis]BDU77411.1 hypothetical protein METESE_23690 [Mesoterricola sediminis]
MKLARLFVLAALACAPALRAGEAAPEVQAKFLKVIVSSSGSNRIACSDPALRPALEALGLQVDGNAQVIWATSVPEAKVSKAMGKLVVAGRRELASASCVLIEEEGGRPKLLLNTNNLRSSKVQLGDALLKLAEKI